MIYRDFQGKRISALGFGTMRLPLKSDSDSDVDEELAVKMFDLARRRRKLLRHRMGLPRRTFGSGGGQAVKALSAREVFARYRIAHESDESCLRIINRKGDGLCPMEKAVLDIDDPLQAKEAILARLAEMKK